MAALLHAYNEFKWDKVETYMNDENIAARSLVEKLGGVKTKRKKFPDGLSRYIYELPKPANQADLNTLRFFPRIIEALGSSIREQ
jgi:hypothetical protein